MYGDEDRGVTILITLLTLSGPGKGRRLMVGDKSLYRIGGSGSCDLVLEGAADGHAEIRVLPGGQLELCPGGALTVNGRPVNGPLTVAVGDRIETDILGGQKAGLKTALVLSGIATRAEGEAWQPKIDLILPELGELL